MRAVSSLSRVVSSCRAAGRCVAVSTDAWRTGVGRLRGRCAPSAVYGRPRTGRASGLFRLGAPVSRFYGASAITLVACRSSACLLGTVCPCRGRSGLMSFATPGRLGTVPRRAGQRRPAGGPARTRTPSVGIGPRAAMLVLTSPAHVLAGQRPNVPKMHPCGGYLQWTSAGLGEFRGGSYCRYFRGYLFAEAEAMTRAPSGGRTGRSLVFVVVLV